MASPVAKLGFWGVRGSTPTVDRANWRYGGNTACLELVTPERTRFILDCGTGLRVLGNRWVENFGQRPMEAHVFVSHYHWDHIQGLPFFAPLYNPQNRFHFYSFRSEHLGRHSLQQVMEAQMAAPYFPVDTRAMSAAREFTEISSGDRMEINGTRVTALALNHPQGCLGFRLETSAGTIVYTTDNEPGNAEMDRNLLQLAAGADIFINDAQYSPEQLATTRRGWGHSSWAEGVRVARETGARELVLFHHDPDSNDYAVDELLRNARQQMETTWAAAEGMVMQLAGGDLSVTLRAPRTGLRREAYFRATVIGHTEDGQAFEEKTAVRDISLQGAFLYLAHPPKLRSELRLVLEAPVDEHHPDGQIRMRAFVVRTEPVPGRNLTGVGLVFAEDPPPDAPGE